MICFFLNVGQIIKLLQIQVQKIKEEVYNIMHSSDKITKY